MLGSLTKNTLLHTLGDPNRPVLAEGTIAKEMYDAVTSLEAISKQATPTGATIKAELTDVDVKE
jgi:hypothetical protein